MRLLDRLFELSPIDNKLIAAVIDKLADKDLSMAMVVIEVLLAEAPAENGRARATSEASTRVIERFTRLNGS